MTNGTFREELISLINRHSRENRSDTPDHILGSYLLSCLENFEGHIVSREIWYGRIDTSPYEATIEITRKGEKLQTNDD